MTTKPRQVILEVCNWIAKREEANLHMENILTSICTILDDDPGRPNIQHLQAKIPSLCSRIAELTDKIGVGYIAFDSHTSP